jgi:hypothetical protein
MALLFLDDPNPGTVSKGVIVRVAASQAPVCTQDIMDCADMPTTRSEELDDDGPNAT